MPDAAPPSPAVPPSSVEGGCVAIEAALDRLAEARAAEEARPAAPPAAAAAPAAAPATDEETAAELAAAYEATSDLAVARAEVAAWAAWAVGAAAELRERRKTLQKKLATRLRASAMNMEARRARVGHSEDLRAMMAHLDAQAARDAGAGAPRRARRGGGGGAAAPARTRPASTRCTS